MKKGISLVSLIVMLVVLIILATTVTITGIDAMNNAKKVKFASELVFMQETIQNYEDTHNGILPVKGDIITSEKLPEDEYYEVDMALLGLIDTTYGNKLNSDEEDVYIVSKTSNEVFYLKGLKIGNNIYYNLTDDLKESINYTDTKITTKDGIIFTPSELSYTNVDITVTVQVPTEYSDISVISDDNEITEFITEKNYNIYNVVKNNNSNIDVLYTKDSVQLQQTYTISNFDNVEPTIEILEKTKLISDNEEKTSITIAVDDDLSGVETVLYATDNVDKEYFETENKGKQIKNNNVVVDKYTQYITFCVVDKAGNTKILVEKLNATATENDYVKYGLILHYDGINNTGNGHSSTTTVWKDLSGNGNNGVLEGFSFDENNGWQTESLYINGANRVIASDVESTNFTDSDFSISITIINKADSGPVIVSNGVWKAKGFYVQVRSDNKLSINVNQTDASQGLFSPINTMYADQKYNIVFVRKSKNMYCYINGEKVSETNSIIDPENTDLAYRINANKNWIGNMMNTRVYNRALTEDEVKQNYKIDKIRFGI